MSRGKIVYEDITPYALDHTVFAATDKHPFVDINVLNFPPTPYTDFAFLQKKYIRLDGTKKNLPDDLYTEDWGLLSLSKTDDSGLLPAPIVVTATLDALYKTIGITLIFNIFDNSYPKNINLKFYNGSSLLLDRDFQPDRADYFAGASVEYFNKVTLTVYDMNKPDRFLWLQRFVYGQIHTFETGELTQHTLSQSIIPDGSDIAIDSLNAIIISRRDMDFMFLRKQPVRSYHDGVLQGSYYISTSERQTLNKYALDCDGATGLLDIATFWGGIYEGVRAIDLIDQIIAISKVNIIVQESLKNIVLTGYLPICTCRYALTQIVFAIGSVESTTKSENINIYELDNSVISHFDMSRYKFGPTVKTLDVIIAAVSLASYSWAKSTESVELYKGEMSGTATIRFTEPAHSLTISGGTIVDSGVNYATISGSGEVILNGLKYIKTEKITAKQNPLVSADELGSTKEFTGYTLISSSNVEKILDICYNIAIRKEEITADVILGDEKVGDTVSIDTIFGTKTGIITNLDTNISNIMMSSAVILA